jgi:ABC-2 type transport system ATP-binding protein
VSQQYSIQSVSGLKENLQTVNIHAKSWSQSTFADHAESQNQNISADTALELHAVSKHFGSVEALRNISFTVQQGEVVALLGPNGAGKTTTISLILGLRRPTSGSVRLLGLDPHQRRARSRCGVMLQDSGVPMNLKVGELIDLFRSYYPHPLPTEQVLVMADLEEKANILAGTLSGGQRQRLYFALAICGDPEVIFLDEPTAALDVEARRSFWAQVRKFAQSGKTILFTTHYLEEADSQADRVIVIAQGRVIADAAPTALKARFSGKRISFDLQRSLNGTAFEGLPLDQLQLSSDRVEFITQEPEAVLSALSARGIQVHNLEVAGTSLEEAVLDLTKTRDQGV